MVGRILEETDYFVNKKQLPLKAEKKEISFYD